MRPPVAVLDYGVGNLHSAAKALDRAGADVRVVPTVEEAAGAAGLVGVAWLLLRRERQALVAASFSICYYVAASQTNAPHIRYAVPLAVGLAVAFGVSTLLHGSH